MHSVVGQQLQRGLAEAGATLIFGETTEVTGGEDTIMQQCANKKITDQFKAAFDDYQDLIQSQGVYKLWAWFEANKKQIEDRLDELNGRLERRRDEFVRLVSGPRAAMTADEKKLNRLARETSPYLRQHADNPVDWYPWGEEAFARARDEDRPVLLSISYSACHWCHVMAHESFEDAEIASLMNREFVNIKTVYVA